MTNELQQKCCILTDEVITTANDSKAHVIPSALGGRCKPTGILTKAGNGILDRKFEAPWSRPLNRARLSVI